MSVTKTPILIITFLLIISINTFAQVSISGNIVNADNEEPIVNANVFIAFSTLGTISDSDGNFEIANVPEGDYELVVSHVAFENAILVIKAINEMAPLSIRLIPSKIVLEAVTVVDKKDREWKRNFRSFKKDFLGTTENARSCKIENPWVISISKNENGVFKATASDLISIKNNALGYKISFFLQNFVIEKSIVQYSGKPKFEEMVSESGKLEKKWKRNRTKTYQGSLSHFFKALVTNSLKEQGFEIYLAKANSQNDGFEVLSVARPKDIVYPNRDGSTYSFHVVDFLKVVYTKEKEENAYKLQRKGRSSRSSFSAMGKQQTTGKDWGEKEPLGATPLNPQRSYIYLRKNKIKLYSNGQPANPEYILEYGYWAWERVAELMPFDYTAE